MPVAINGVDKQGVYVNGVQVKQALSAANETVSKGVYVATTLSAVDGDLAVGNIKKDEVIFGFTGTFENTLAEDVEGDAVDATIGSYATGGRSDITDTVKTEETVLATRTLTFDASSLAFAVASTAGEAEQANAMYFRLYMGGVLMQQSAFLSSTFACSYVLYDFAALSGEQICKGVVYNWGGANLFFERFTDSSGNGEVPAAIAVGSVKLA